MLARFWRDGIFPRHANKFRSAFSAAAVETATIATVIILIGTLLAHADGNEAQADRLDTEHLFEEHLSNAVLGVGSILFIGGTIQLFCRSIEIRRGKRGQIHVGLTFRNWSLRSVWPGISMIVVGALVMGGPHFG